MTSSSRVIGVCLGLCCCLVSLGADWPQFLGPNRTGSSPETGLLASWDARGPRVLWKVEGGDGYASVAVSGNRAITLVQRGEDELALALEAATGKEIWKQRLGRAYTNEYGNGPRSTPTIDGSRVFIQSVSGSLFCLETATGKVVWQKDLLREFGIPNITWGLTSSPLIEGELVLAQPGGKEASAAAFRRTTGELVWKVGSDKAAYASPLALTAAGVRQAIFFTAGGLLSVAPTTGKELWRYPWVTEYDVNICTPLVLGDSLFVSTGEKVGCALLRVEGETPPRVVWESRGAKSVMINYWANAVTDGKYLYGLAGEYNGPIALRCVEATTGKLIWSKDRFGFANVALADGKLWLTTAKGELVLVTATSRGYEEKGRVQLLGESRYATMPTIAGKRLFLRDLQRIICLDIAAP